MGERTSRSRLTRRGFLAGAGAGLLAPRSLAPGAARASVPREPDVVVVGAGAAGLAAARRLLAENLTVLVVEARGRIGGRAHTEHASLGAAFDHGCSWISSAHAHPLKALADRWGFETHYHGEAQEALFVGGRPATAQEWRAYERDWSGVIAALGAAADRDVAASSVAPAETAFGPTAQTWIGPLDMGVDFKDLSTLDYAQGASTHPSYMVKQGLGALVARLGEGLPLKLSTPVSRIDWGGAGVAVETPAGRIRAKAVIVTVSTGVLSTGRLVFDPPLPAWKQAAIDGLPMGLLAKIALKFDGQRFGLKPNDWLTYQVAEPLPAEACYFLTWPFDFDHMIGFVGGDFGWALSRAGEAAAIDFALGELQRMLGSQVRAAFVDGVFTPWASDPWTLGAYAALRPGAAGARDALSRPLGARVFFAGEAVAGAYAATCGGAYRSGEDAAREVARILA